MGPPFLLQLQPGGREGTLVDDLGGGEGREAVEGLGGERLGGDLVEGIGGERLGGDLVEAFG